MKKKLHYVLLLLILALRVALKAEETLSSGMAEVTFIRFPGMPDAVKGEFLIDGKEVGKIRPKHFAIFKVPAGVHEIRFKFPFWAGMKELHGKVKWDANRKYFLCYESKTRPVFILAEKMTWGLREMTESEAKEAENRYHPVDSRDWPNQSPEPTATASTPPADAGAAPASAVAHH
jgi:hypothetical protein